MAEGDAGFGDMSFFLPDGMIGGDDDDDRPLPPAPRSSSSVIGERRPLPSSMGFASGGGAPDGGISSGGVNGLAQSPTGSHAGAGSISNNSSPSRGSGSTVIGNGGSLDSGASLFSNGLSDTGSPFRGSLLGGSSQHSIAPGIGQSLGGSVARGGGGLGNGLGDWNSLGGGGLGGDIFLNSGGSGGSGGGGGGGGGSSSNRNLQSSSNLSMPGFGLGVGNGSFASDGDDVSGSALTHGSSSNTNNSVGHGIPSVAPDFVQQQAAVALEQQKRKLVEQQEIIRQLMAQQEALKRSKALQDQRLRNQQQQQHQNQQQRRQEYKQQQEQPKQKPKQKDGKHQRTTKDRKGNAQVWNSNMASNNAVQRHGKQQRKVVTMMNHDDFVRHRQQQQKLQRKQQQQQQRQQQVTQQTIKKPSHLRASQGQTRHNKAPVQRAKVQQLSHTTKSSRETKKEKQPKKEAAKERSQQRHQKQLKAEKQPHQTQTNLHADTPEVDTIPTKGHKGVGEKSRSKVENNDKLKLKDPDDDEIPRDFASGKMKTVSTSDGPDSNGRNTAATSKSDHEKPPSRKSPTKHNDGGDKSSGSGKKSKSRPNKKEPVAEEVVEAEAVHVVDAESLSLFAVFCAWFNPTPVLMQLSEALATSAALFGGMIALFIALWLGGLSVIISLHHYANGALLSDYNVTGTYAFLYFFPWLVRYTIPWAPPWAPICLWYCFLVQLFCTAGTGAEAESKSHRYMVSIARMVVPAMFLVEGVSYHSFLLDLSGGDLLALAYVLSTLRSAKVTNIVFVFTFSFQILVSVFFGRSFIGNWVQAVTGLLSVKMVQIYIRKSAIEQHQQAWSMKENSTYYSMMQRIETGNKSSNGPTGSSSSGMFNRLHNASQHEQHEKIYREYQNRQKRHLYQLRIQREMLNEEKRIRRDVGCKSDEKSPKHKNDNIGGRPEGSMNYPSPGDSGSSNLSSEQGFIWSILGKQVIKKGASWDR
eukprot:g4521.t1